jgi:hypothetical protein
MTGGSTSGSLLTHNGEVPSGQAPGNVRGICLAGCCVSAGGNCSSKRREALCHKLKGSVQENWVTSCAASPRQMSCTERRALLLRLRTFDSVTLRCHASHVASEAYASLEQEPRGRFPMRLRGLALRVCRRNPSVRDRLRTRA